MQEQNRTNGSQKESQIEIYTAVIGERDWPRDDIKCFVDYDEFKRPVMNAKIYKILAHQYLDCDISIWVDGNIFLLVDPDKLVEEFLGDADMAVWKHFERDDVYEECDACIGATGDHIPYVIEHKKYLEETNFPRKTGLAECNVIIRRHTKDVEIFNNAWWSEICRHSSRDQISFPKVLLENPIKVNFIEGNVRNHPYFKYIPH